MGDNEAPDIDGFNAKFCKSGWNVAKKDVITFFLATNFTKQPTVL